MKGQESNFVALTKCYYCLGDNYIAFQRNLRDISEYHGKVVDMTPCNQCQEYMKQGVILITIDSEKSPKNWNMEEIPNPYRTGGFFVVSEDAVKKMLTEENEKAIEFALKCRWMFIEHQTALDIGLFALVEEKEDDVQDS